MMIDNERDNYDLFHEFFKLVDKCPNSNPVSSATKSVKLEQDIVFRNLTDRLSMSKSYPKFKYAELKEKLDLTKLQDDGFSNVLRLISSDRNSRIVYAVESFPHIGHTDYTIKLTLSQNKNPKVTDITMRVYAEKQITTPSPFPTKNIIAPTVLTSLILAGLSEFVTSAAAVSATATTAAASTSSSAATAATSIKSAAAVSATATTAAASTSSSAATISIVSSTSFITGLSSSVSLPTATLGILLTSAIVGGLFLPEYFESANALTTMEQYVVWANESFKLKNYDSAFNKFETARSIYEQTDLNIVHSSYAEELYLLSLTGQANSLRLQAIEGVSPDKDKLDKAETILKFAIDEVILKADKYIDYDVDNLWLARGLNSIYYEPQLTVEYCSKAVPSVERYLCTAEANIILSQKGNDTSSFVHAELKNALKMAESEEQELDINDKIQTLLKSYDFSSPLLEN